MVDEERGNGFLSSIRKHGSMAIAVLCWLLAFAIGFVFREPFLDLENSLFDLRMRLPHRVKASDNIVYVDIDDHSMTLLGRWPWPRSQIGEIVRTLNQADIWGLFVDVIFSEETTAAEDLALTQELEQIENLFLGIGARLLKPDERSPQGQSPSPILTSFCYDFKMEGGSRALRVGRTLIPMPPLLALGPGLGHISFVPDDDGVARHIPLLVDLNGRCFPSIDVEIARRILDVGQEGVRIVPRHRVVMAGARLPGLTERADVRIPVDSQMRMLINYAGQWGRVFKHYPLHSVLRSLLSENDAERRKAETLLEGNLVILSAAYSGSTDMGPTPLEPLAPLSEIHAHAISSIVNQQFLKRVPITVTMLIVLPICLLLGFLSPKCHTLHFSGISAGVAVLWIAAAFVLFSMVGLVVDIVWPGAAILLSYGGCAGYIHWRTERERASLRNAFSNYVSPDVLSQILKDPGMLMLGGERVDLSILVFILENFEQFCENAEPEEIIELLTSIYEDACGAILSHGGTVDKFTKDGLIAFFGAPIRQEDHPQSAAMAALSIRQKMTDLAVSRSERGQKTVGAKMAVNTGFATVGNIGSSKRMDYTVIGRTVNLCIRIAQSAAEGQIAVTRKTYQKMGDLFKAEECGEIRVSTHSKPFFILNILGMGEAPESVPAAPSSQPMAMDGKKFLGPYTLVEKLGTGSTGTVYRGYDESLDRQVAIKVLLPGLQKDKMSIITEEAKILAKLSHPNIVQVYYAGEEDDIGFLAMEFVDGVNLRELLNTEGPLPADDVLDIIIQTSRGLNAAHKQGIIHRDIKPANLLLNNHGIIKIADFGLAGVAISQQKEGRRIAGTFHYTSPEQAKGLAVDCRSDMYSLGITFFHLLTGEPPFKADTMAGLIWHHTESDLPVEPLQSREVPDCVITTIRKMTAKSPSERYASYIDLLKELDKVEDELAT